MMKLLSLLAYTAVVLVAGFLCALLVRGKGDPLCTWVGVPSIEATDQRYVDELATTQQAHLDRETELRREVNALLTREQDMTKQVKALEEAARKANAELVAIQETAVRQMAEVQQVTKQWSEQNAGLLKDLAAALDERDEVKQALKQLRADYIALANKNAALERVSIAELAKAHKEGTKVTQRELPPIMQAVVNMGGVPSGKQVPRPVLP